MDTCIYDQHLHSSFSFDADPEGTIGHITLTAIEKGLSGIAVTDHFDPLWPDDDEPSILDVPAYQSALTESENIYGDRIKFAKGIEVGMMPGEALTVCEDVVSGFPYDFVIGAVHSSTETPIDYKPFHEGRTIREIIDEYYTILLESIRKYKNYDVIGHINAIDRYTENFASEDVYMPYIDEVLKQAISDGKGIEINTSAFRYGIGDRGTPTQPILNRFKELGGEIVTIGSDAHRAADVGANIKQGEDMLLASGLHYFAVFKNRRPEFIKL